MAYYYSMLMMCCICQYVRGEGEGGIGLTHSLTRHKSSPDTFLELSSMPIDLNNIRRPFSLTGT